MKHSEIESKKQAMARKILDTKLIQKENNKDKKLLQKENNRDFFCGIAQFVLVTLLLTVVLAGVWHIYG